MQSLKVFCNLYGLRNGTSFAELHKPAEVRTAQFAFERRPDAGMVFNLDGIPAARCLAPKAELVTYATGDLYPARDDD